MAVERRGEKRLNLSRRRNITRVGVAGGPRWGPLGTMATKGQNGACERKNISNTFDIRKLNVGVERFLRQHDRKIIYFTTKSKIDILQFSFFFGAEKTGNWTGRQPKVAQLVLRWSVGFLIVPVLMHCTVVRYCSSGSNGIINRYYYTIKSIKIIVSVILRHTRTETEKICSHR